MVHVVLVHGAGALTPPDSTPPPSHTSLPQAAHGAFDPHALTPAQTAFLHQLSSTMRRRMVALKREGDAELRRLVEADGRGGDPLR